MDLRDPKELHNMAEVRAQIDRIDGDLIALLKLRQDHVDQAIALKPAEGISAKAPTRTAEVLAKVGARAEAAGFDRALAERIWADMIDTFIAREEHHIGHQGSDA